MVPLKTEHISTTDSIGVKMTYLAAWCHYDDSLPLQLEK